MLISRSSPAEEKINQEQAITAFEKHSIRRFFDEARESWYFSVVDVVAALMDSVNPRDYWFKMKIRVKTEAGFQLSTICRQLKMKAPDGKMRETDCADVEGLFRIIQSIPSPKAEPFKKWLAKVGYERIQDMNDPARSLDRARKYWQQRGRAAYAPDPAAALKALRNTVVRFVDPEKPTDEAWESSEQGRHRL